MEYIVRTDAENEPVRVSDAESGQQPKAGQQPRPKAAPQLAAGRPVELPRAYSSEKATADSVPGSEYWLP